MDEKPQLPAQMGRLPENREFVRKRVGLFPQFASHSLTYCLNGNRFSLVTHLLDLSKQFIGIFAPRSLPIHHDIFVVYSDVRRLLVTVLPIKRDRPNGPYADLEV